MVIAEAANSQWTSVPLVGWSIAEALHNSMEAHIVTQVRNRQAFLDEGFVENEDFTAVDSEKVAKAVWRISSFLSGGSGKGWTIGTAFSALSYYYFEHLVWKIFREKIKAGEFHVIHRVTPLSPTIPSLLAKKSRKAGVPFVLGPLNGGVPWPKGFHKARLQENEWLSYIRNAYKLLPGYRSTLKNCSAVITGSRYTKSQVPYPYLEKCIYIPENAINPKRFNKRTKYSWSAELRACFVGRLVPYKGPDMLLEAALPLLQNEQMSVDIIGDGPLALSIKNYIDNNGISGQVTLHGWVNHSSVQEIMVRSNVLAFPSIREFGGGVVLEAMALGVVPIVVDYAGPGELVNETVGIKVEMGERKKIVSGFRYEFYKILQREYDLKSLSDQAAKRIKSHYTWTAKAEQIYEIYDWVLRGRTEKPEPFKNISD